MTVEFRNAIQNRISSDTFDSQVSPLTAKELPATKEVFGFQWRKELATANRQVFKLTLKGNPRIIQGLLCLEVKPDHVFIHLLESASFNQGSLKVYEGVPGNLLAFAGQVAVEKEFACLALESKTKLIPVYQLRYGFERIGRSNLMMLEGKKLLSLIRKYDPTPSA